MEKEQAGMSLSRTIKMILKLQVGFVGRTRGISWNPGGGRAADPMGTGPRGWGSPPYQLSRHMAFYLSFCLHIYRQTSEIVWVQFQTTTVKQVT